jgi:hypothetical protein
MCHPRRLVRPSRILSRLAPVVAVAHVRAEPRVPLLLALRVRVREVRLVPRARLARGPAARRTSPVAGAAGVEAAASPAAAGVAVR